MIRHDDILFNLCGVPNILLRDSAIGLRDDEGIVPYDV